MTRRDELRTTPTYELKSELGYKERSLAWTISRAGVEGTKIDFNALRPIYARIDAIKEELERREKTPCGK